MKGWMVKRKWGMSIVELCCLIDAVSMWMMGFSLGIPTFTCSPPREHFYLKLSLL
jgi:hypothetical protein